MIKYWYWVIDENWGFLFFYFMKVKIKSFYSFNYEICLDQDFFKFTYLIKT